MANETVTVGAPSDLLSDIDASSPEHLLALTDALQRRVDLIADQLAEKKKPFYKQPAVLISVSATVFSVISGFYTMRAAHIADLQTAVSALVQLRLEDSQDSTASKNDPAGYAARSLLRNIRRVAQLELAESKLGAATGKVPSSFYYVLGTEASNDGMNDTALQHFKDALDSSPKTPPGAVPSVERAGVLFTFIQFCSLQGEQVCKTNKQSEKVDIYKKEYLQEPPKFADDASRFRYSYALVQIAGLIHQKGVHEEEIPGLLKHAQDQGALVANSNAKQQIATLVGNMRMQIAPAPPANQINFSNYVSWLGEWRLLDTDRKPLGAVTFVALPSGTDFTASVRILDGVMLVEKQWGTLLLESPTRALMDWNSVAANRQSTGYSRFYLSNKSHGMRLEQFRLGEPMAVFTLER